MSKRKRHGRRRANRGTPRETPSILSRRAVRRARKAERVERYWQARGLRVTSVPGAVIVHVAPPMPDPGDPETWLPTVRGNPNRERMRMLGEHMAEGFAEGVSSAPVMLRLDSQGGTMADFRQMVSAITGSQSPILARYDREIAHARARGLPLTAERIEHERAEFLEVCE